MTDKTIDFVDRSPSDELVTDSLILNIHASIGDNFILLKINWRLNDLALYFSNEKKDFLS